MRASSALAVLAVLALAHIGSASNLYADEELAAVSQQRSRSLLQTVPVYGPVCPLSNYPSERKVRVVLTITSSGRSRARFGIGQKALYDKIRAVYAKTDRPSITQNQIVGPAGQLPVFGQKNFIYTFTLPLGKCGADKKALSDQLAQAIKKAKGGRVKRVRLSSFK